MKVSTPANLFDFLLEKVATSSKSNIKQMIKLGKVSVDGIPIFKADHILRENQNVEIVRKSKVSRSMKKTAEAFPYTILYEDDYMVALEKPEGMLSIGNTRTKGKDFYSRVKFYFLTRKENPTELFWVQGLDKDISGIMVFAKNELTQTTLKMFWKQTNRRYVALVEGEMPADEGIIDAHLTDDKRIVKKMAAPCSEYKVLKKYKNHTLVQIEPLVKEEKHHVRKHLAHVKCPVVGDYYFGSHDFDMKRLALHLFHINVQHPVNKTRIKITTPIPKLFTGYAK